MKITKGSRQPPPRTPTENKRLISPSLANSYKQRSYMQSSTTKGVTTRFVKERERRPQAGPRPRQREPQISIADRAAKVSHKRETGKTKVTKALPKWNRARGRRFAAVVHSPRERRKGGGEAVEVGGYVHRVEIRGQGVRAHALAKECRRLTPTRVSSKQLSHG